MTIHIRRLRNSGKNAFEISEELGIERRLIYSKVRMHNYDPNEPL